MQAGSQKLAMEGGGAMPSHRKQLGVWRQSTLPLESGVKGKASSQQESGGETTALKNFVFFWQKKT